MPRDLEAELARRQQKTDQLVSGVPISRRRSLLNNEMQLNQRRGNFVNQTVNPTLAGFGTIPTQAVSLPLSRMARELSRNTATGIFGAQRNALDLGMQTRQRRAQESTNRLQDTNAYLRLLGSDNQRRAFDAEQLQTSIETEKQKEALADEYARKGVALQDSYAPEMDYQSALTRALTGLAGSVGTAYLLNKSGNSGSNPAGNTMSQNPFGRTELPYGPSQNFGYYPQRPTGGYR